MVACFPRLWPIFGAVFAVDRPAGAVVEGLQALHHPGLVAELPASLTAGAPFLYHPPVRTAGFFESFHVTRQLNFSSSLINYVKMATWRERHN